MNFLQITSEFSKPLSLLMYLRKRFIIIIFSNKRGEVLNATDMTMTITLTIVHFSFKLMKAWNHGQNIGKNHFSITNFLDTNSSGQKK